MTTTMIASDAQPPLPPPPFPPHPPPTLLLPLLLLLLLRRLLPLISVGSFLGLDFGEELFTEKWCIQMGFERLVLGMGELGEVTC
jgi:hypothetical protein